MANAVAVITGASSGIGAVFARRLARDYDLILIARRKDRLDQLANELRSLNGAQKVEVIAADLATDEDCGRVMERLRGESRLGLLINNAGFGSRGRLWETKLEEQEQMHRLHVLATLRLTHAALPGMVARDSGGIINVSSVAAFVRSPGSASYCATKSWMTVFTEALYLELLSANSQVRVQALCPGYTYSEFHDVLGVNRYEFAPRRLWMTADDVVDASLDGLARGKLFVVPGRMYRLIAALIPKLPTRLRLMMEARVTRSRYREFGKGKQPNLIDR